MELNKVHFKSSIPLEEVENNSASLVICTPPFTFEKDGKKLKKLDYFFKLQIAFEEYARVLPEGGVLATINTDMKDQPRYTSQKHERPLPVWHKHHILYSLAEDNDFQNFSVKIWQKRDTQDIYRFGFSYIQLFFKKGKQPYIKDRYDKEFGVDVWPLFDSMKRKDSKGLLFRDAIHPEVGRRIINQFTKQDDLVLIPFAGSGTLPAVAHDMKRNYIGYEINKDLELLIKETIHGPRPKIFSSPDYKL